MMKRWEKLPEKLVRTAAEVKGHQGSEVFRTSRASLLKSGGQGYEEHPNLLTIPERFFHLLSRFAPTKIINLYCKGEFFFFMWQVLHFS